MKIVALRGVMVDGQRIAPGVPVEVDASAGAQLVQMGRAIVYEEPVAVAQPTRELSRWAQRGELKLIKGVGLVMQGKMNEMGLMFVPDLVKADTAVVAEKLGVSVERVEQWKEAAYDV